VQLPIAMATDQHSQCGNLIAEDGSNKQNGFD